MSKRSIVFKQIPTTVADKVIDVELSYNDGSMNRAHRGYWLAARIYTEEGIYRSTDVFGGSKFEFVERADRFNANKLTSLADELEQRRIEYENLVTNLRTEKGI